MLSVNGQLLLFSLCRRYFDVSRAKDAIRRYLDAIDKDGRLKSGLQDQASHEYPFPKTTLSEVAACLPAVTGKGKSLQKMDTAIKKGAKKRKPKA
jgi:hypothetical protein